MHGRRLVILIAGNFFVATSFMSVSGLLNEIAVSLQISVAKAGALIAAFALTAGFFAPVLATFGSRIDRRYLLTGALAVCALASGLAAASDNYRHLLLARIVAAAASAVYTPQVAAAVSMLTPEKDRAPVLGKLMLGWAIGSVVGGPLTVLIGGQFGWRTAMACIGAGGVAVSLLVWRAVPSNVHVPALNLQRWIEVARSPALRWLMLTTALNTAGNHFVFSYLAPTLSALHQVSGSVLSALYFVSGLGGLAGSVWAVSILARVSAARVAYWSTGVVIVVYLVWPLCAPWLPLLFTLQFLWSAGSAGFPSVQQSRFVAVAPTLASATIAMNSSLGYLGNSVGTSLGGSAWLWVGPRFLPWLGVVFLAASLFCSAASERATKIART